MYKDTRLLKPICSIVEESPIGALFSEVQNLKLVRHVLSIGWPIVSAGALGIIECFVFINFEGHYTDSKWSQHSKRVE